MSHAHTRVYRKGQLETEDFAVASVSEYLEDPDTTVWVDFRGPSKDDLREVAGELGIHELAVEDALEPHQRPKIDHYESHLFLSCHAVRVNVERSGLDVSEIDAFIGDRWLVTVRREDGWFSMEQVLARWDRTAHLSECGVSFLLYGLLDVVVDGYFDAVQVFDDYYDTTSEGIFDTEPLDPAQQRNWFEMRRALAKFHRLVVLKKVTSWAAIIAVPTLVTGFYGMNVPYPGSGETWGVVVSVALLVTCSLALYLSFKRRDWL